MIVCYPDSLAFACLPTKLLMMRVKMLQIGGANEKLEEAIEMVHDYFSRNQEMLTEDLNLLFPESKQEGH